jgi:hypothetical protein
MRSGVLISAAWGIILLAALVRPGVMSYYSNYVGIGTYPDPVKKLRTLFGRQ